MLSEKSKYLFSTKSRVHNPQALEAMMEEIRTHIRALKSAEWGGDIGEAFEDALTKTDVKESILSNAGIESKGNLGAFRSYSSKHRHENDIRFKRREVLRSASKFILARIHEGFHALQNANAPILHASLYNIYSPVFLHPRDIALTRIIGEWDAYAKSASLWSLVLEMEPDFDEDHEMFEMVLWQGLDALIKMTTRDDNLALKMNVYADILLRQLPLRADHPKDSGEPLAVQWSRDEFVRYLHSMDRLVKHIRKTGERPYVICRAEPTDLVRIGGNIGPNLFEDPSCPLDLEGFELEKYLRPELLTLYRDITKRMHMPAYDKLPTFSEVLDGLNISPDEFMDISRDNTIQQEWQPGGRWGGPSPS